MGHLPKDHRGRHVSDRRAAHGCPDSRDSSRGLLLGSRWPIARYNKGSREGLDKRAALLRSFEPETQRLVARILNLELRKNVSEDDVLDALVAFVTSRVPNSQLRSSRSSCQRLRERSA